MKNLIPALALVLLAFSPSRLPAAEAEAPMIAVAANFAGAMAKIAAAYQAQTGVKVRTVYSSTGTLYAQIKNGAPYDLLLAADARRPELLAAAGLCAEPFIYATGAAVLWTKNAAFAGEKRWQDVVVRAEVQKIAISAPETAPYGAAAMTALKKTGLLPQVDRRLVYGQNVGQAFQFAYHGSTSLGFTALALARSDKGRAGIFWAVPEAPAVVQKGCLVTTGAAPAATQAFLAFFHREGARHILNELGYK
jgi:molybdate transport system substrate-binding protein